MPQFHGPHTRQGYIQQYLLSSNEVRMVILIQSLHAGKLPAKREQAVKKQTDVKKNNKFLSSKFGRPKYTYC